MATATERILRALDKGRASLIKLLKHATHFQKKVFEKTKFLSCLIWGRFHKTKTPKFVLQNSKMFKAFSLFNFIKASMPKFSQHNAIK